MEIRYFIASSVIGSKRLQKFQSVKIKKNYNTIIVAKLKKTNKRTLLYLQRTQNLGR